MWLTRGGRHILDLGSFALAQPYGAAERPSDLAGISTNAHPRRVDDGQEALLPVTGVLSRVSSTAKRVAFV
jgi:hypothetical protein